MKPSSKLLFGCFAVAAGFALGCGDTNEAPKRRAPVASSAPSTSGTTTAKAEATKTDAAPATASGWGNIKGKVVWKGALPPAVNINVTKDQEYCLAKGALPDETIVIDKESKGVLNVFAYVKGDKKMPMHADYPNSTDDAKAKFMKDFEAENKIPFSDIVKAVADKKIEMRDIKAPFIIDQNHCLYVPHALAIREGVPTLILNPEPIAHNVKVADPNPGGRNEGNNNMPAGTMTTASWVAGVYPMRIECGIHPWMNMMGMVFDHPYFTVSAKDGSFEIKNVPAGEHTFFLRGSTFIDAQTGKVGSSRGNKITVKAGETLDLGTIEFDNTK